MSIEEVTLEHVLRRLKIDGEGRLLFGSTPMILTPRFLFKHIQETLEELGGEGMTSAVMTRAGFKAGYGFAEAQAKLFGLRGAPVFKKYVRIASFRGWGKFEILEFDPEVPRARVRIYASYGEEQKGRGRAACYIWRGAIAGILQYIADSEGREVRVAGREEMCVAKGDPYCEIVAEPY